MNLDGPRSRFAPPSLRHLPVLLRRSQSQSLCAKLAPRLPQSTTAACLSAGSADSSIALGTVFQCVPSSLRRLTTISWCRKLVPSELACRPLRASTDPSRSRSTSPRSQSHCSPDRTSLGNSRATSPPRSIHTGGRPRSLRSHRRGCMSCAVRKIEAGIVHGCYRYQDETADLDGV